MVAAPELYEEPVPVSVSPGQQAWQAADVADGYLDVDGGAPAAERRAAAGKRGIRSRNDRKASLCDGFGDNPAAAEVNYGLQRRVDGQGQPGTSDRSCSYTARDGRRCQSPAATWSNQCTIHTCGRTGCIQPKSSRVEHCAEHGGASQSTA